MGDSKIIAIVGATGAQGSGLVRAILEDPAGGFTARALTRNTESPKARQLAELGVEVVAADVDDRASLERAFAGAYGAYCVTFYWEHFSPAKEASHAQNMAAAANAELAALVRDIVGFEGKIGYDAAKPDGTPRKLVDTTKINALGWKASIGLREGIEATYQWFLDNVDQLRGTP